MQNKQYRNKREYYRIMYPLICRPKLMLLNNEYEVIDISEKGVRFLCKKFEEFECGLEVHFKMIFRDDESLDLSGKILRVDQYIVVIHLAKEIPFVRIVQEQRFIAINYPDHL